MAVSDFQVVMISCNCCTCIRETNGSLHNYVGGKTLSPRPIGMVENAGTGYRIRIPDTGYRIRIPVSGIRIRYPYPVSVSGTRVFYHARPIAVKMSVVGSIFLFPIFGFHFIFSLE